MTKFLFFIFFSETKKDKLPDEVFLKGNYDKRCVHVCVCVYVCVCVCVSHTHTHTHNNNNTHTHKHTHTHRLLPTLPERQLWPGARMQTLLLLQVALPPSRLSGMGGELEGRGPGGSRSSSLICDDLCSTGNTVRLAMLIGLFCSIIGLF